MHSVAAYAFVSVPSKVSFNSSLAHLPRRNDCCCDLLASYADCGGVNVFHIVSIVSNTVAGGVIVASVAGGASGLLLGCCDCCVDFI